MSRENEQFERKLNPIYDALHIRNYKGGIKLIDAALKKQKGNQVLRSLKAYALVGSGKRDEASQILSELTADGPESERVLNVMVMSYKVIGQPEAIIPAYSAAVERNPSDVDLAVGLFGAYARSCNYVKQQQLALKLAKSVPPTAADHFSWWAICSIFMQARDALHGESTSLLPSSKLMQLAATMADRQAARGPQKYEALLLYTDILQGLGRAADASKIIESADDAAIPMPGDRLHLHAAALARAGDLPAASSLYRKACIENLDDYLCWSLYLDCILPSTALLSSTGSGNSSRFPGGIVSGLAEAWDANEGKLVWKDAAAASGQNYEASSIFEAIEAANSTLQEMQAAIKTNNSNTDANMKSVRKIRGLAVAAPELALRKLRLDLPNAEAELASAIAEALPVLCDAFSCVADLQIYLTALKQEDTRTVVYNCAVQLSKDGPQQEQQPKNGNSNSKADEINALQRCVNAYRIGEELGLPVFTSAAAATAHAHTLVAVYAENHHLSEGLDPKDRGYGEDLISMAVGALIRAYALDSEATQSSITTTNRRVDLLVTALLVLEATQVRRKVSAPLRLCSTALCGVLGMPQLASEHFAALDIKSVLHATMTGHWLMPSLLAAAADSEELPRWLNGIISVSTEQVIEAGDALVAAYTHGTYSKVPEFVEFFQRLQHSHSFASAQTELLLCPLRDCAHATAAGPNFNALRAAAEKAASVQNSSSTSGAAQSSLPPLAVATQNKLRFIEDLSMRPAWFPPSALPGPLVIAEWWEELKPALPGTECWWTAAGSSGNETAAAEKWRTMTTQSAKLRALVASLIADGTAGSDCLSEQQLTDFGARIEEYGALVKGLGEVTTRSCGVGVAAFRVSHAVHTAVQKATTNPDNKLLQAIQACEQLSSAVKEAFKPIIDSFNGHNHGENGTSSSGLQLLLLPADSTISLTSALLKEEALWAAACLDNCSKLLKTVEKMTGSASESIAALRQSISAAASQLSQSISDVEQQLAAIMAIDVPSHAANALSTLTRQNSEDVVEKLWAYEPKFDAERALVLMLNDQKQTAGRLQKGALHVLQALKPLL